MTSSVDALSRLRAEVGRAVLPVCVAWNPIAVDPAAGMVAL